ncbi:MAG: Crp/Fnr family transcriptional regulator [Collimonas pratensis]|uniref:Crp/Fnr family transcriptional regulator n=1 Tax=Collimonas pratensis TaxID=279113 RepID=UPI003C71B85E
MAYVFETMHQRTQKIGEAKVSAVLNEHPPSGFLKPDTHGSSPLRIVGVHGHDPLHNHILHALPKNDYQRLLGHLEFIAMPQGMVLCEANSHLQNVYFPTSGIVSLMHETADGLSAEIAAIGREGMLGVSVCMGSTNNLSRAIVTSAGFGFSLNVKLLSEEFEKGTALQNVLLHYLQALMMQISQDAVCQRHHCVFQQLCRWLLLTLDRLPDNEIVATQSMIATLLGVRRESIAESASRLQQQGLIQYARGHLKVLDRTGLENHACECYAAIKNNLQHYLEM